MRVLCLASLVLGVAACGGGEFSAGAGGGSSSAGAGGAPTTTTGAGASGGGGAPTTTSTATTSTSTTTTSTTTSTGSSMGNEDCTNGQDDDDDGKVDCEDEDCNAFTCAPNPGGPWQGPFEVAVGVPLATCDPGLPNAAVLNLGGVIAPPASCGPCSCGAATGGTCGLAGFSWYSDALCGNAGVPEVPAAPSTCMPIGNTDTAKTLGAIGAIPPRVGGSCAPVAGSVDVTPSSFEKKGVLCGGSAGGGCGPDAYCAPQPSNAFDGKLCVSANGDLTCPNGYEHKTLAYGGVDDHRSCSQCSCGAAQGGCGTATTTLFAEANCDAPLVTIPHDGMCHSAQGFVSFRYDPPIQASGGECKASGGEPVGEATPKDPITICCH